MTHYHNGARALRAAVDVHAADTLDAPDWAEVATDGPTGPLWEVLKDEKFEHVAAMLQANLLRYPRGSGVKLEDEKEALKGVLELFKDPGVQSEVLNPVKIPKDAWHPTIPDKRVKGWVGEIPQNWLEPVLSDTDTDTEDEYALATADTSDEEECCLFTQTPLEEGRMLVHIPRFGKGGCDCGCTDASGKRPLPAPRDAPIRHRGFLKGAAENKEKDGGECEGYGPNAAETCPGTVATGAKAALRLCHEHKLMQGRVISYRSKRDAAGDDMATMRFPRLKDDVLAVMVIMESKGLGPAEATAEWRQSEKDDEENMPPIKKARITSEIMTPPQPPEHSEPSEPSSSSSERPRASLPRPLSQLLREDPVALMGAWRSWRAGAGALAGARRWTFLPMRA